MEAVPPMKPVLLVMVKDEYETLPRLLRSVRDHVNAVFILDTGSHDRALLLSLAKSAAPGLECHMSFTEWSDFSTCRNRLLERARVHYPHRWYLLADADWEFSGELPYQTTVPVRPGHGWRFKVTGHKETVIHPCLIAGPGWQYTGAVHEVLSCPEAPMPLPLWTSGQFHHHGDGANKRDDERLLLNAVAADHEDMRSLFYLGMTYYWRQEYYQASMYLSRRYRNESGWEQERWYAGLTWVRSLFALDPADDEIPGLCLKLIREAPTRHEAAFLYVYWVLTNAPTVNTYLMLVDLCDQYDGMGCPPDALFAEEWISMWGWKYQHAHLQFLLDRPFTARSEFKILLKLIPSDQADHASAQRYIDHIEQVVQNRCSHIDIVVE